MESDNQFRLRSGEIVNLPLDEGTRVNLSDIELVDVAIAACLRIQEDHRTFPLNPGSLAEKIDQMTGVGFDAASYVALSEPRI